MFITYRVERDFHFGAIRTALKKGASIQSDGVTVRYRGQVYNAPGFDQLVTAGFFALAEPTPQLPAVIEPVGAEPPVKRPVARPKINATPKEKEAGVPAHLEPDKPHVWEDDLFGNGEKTCTVCGVTMSNPMSANLSKQSLKYIYTDAYGVSISTLKELPCPVFVGDLGGGVATVTHSTRKLTGKVESINERVTRLEQENAELRERADRRQEVALDLLSRLVAAAERLAELGDAKVAPKLLPDHSDIIEAIVVEMPEREKVPLTREEAKGAEMGLPSSEEGL